ncbi:hypothetical protein MMPV_001266 [Pyropia vietnamensis]
MSGAAASDAAAGGAGMGGVMPAASTDPLPLSSPPSRVSSPSSPPASHAATAVTAAGVASGRPMKAPSAASGGAVQVATTKPTSTVAAAPTPAPQRRQPFDWARQWYPLGLVRDLPTDAPTAVTVLDQRLVVWHAGEGKPAAAAAAAAGGRAAAATTTDAQKGGSDSGWRVFYDRCPHRFAALSEGRLDTSTGVPRLQCVYHGWAFGDAGECTRIPQAPAGDKGAPGGGAPGPAACATPLPTSVVGGILFGWLGGTVGATPAAVAATAAEAAAAPPPAAVMDGRDAVTLSSYTRELPIAFTSLLENVVDPAHVVWAHHGLLGHRDDAGPVDVRMLSGGRGADDPAAAVGSGSIGNDGDTGSGGWVADHAGGRVRVEWRPPCMVDIRTAAGFAFSYFAVPVSPGVVRTVAVKTCAPGVGGLRAIAAAALVPRWVDHLRRHQLLEGDLLLMITQEAAVRAADAEGGWRRFYMPTRADQCVVALRRWMDEHGTPWTPPREADVPSAPAEGGVSRAAATTPHGCGGGKDGKDGSSVYPLRLPPLQSLNERRSLLDRTSHLATCASCRAAVNRLVVACVVLRALSLVSAAVGAVAVLTAAGVGAGGAGGDTAAAAATATTAAMPAVGSAAVLTAVVATVATAAVERLLGHFEFVDYRHAHIP